MKIGIVGGGISGTYLALQIKELHPNYDVVIFEHNDKLNKKIYATGNGKCNFANAGSLLDKYNNEEFVLPILNKYGYKEIANYFDSIGIPNILEGNNAYPMSKSAVTVGMMMENRVKELGIEVKLSYKVIDYKLNQNNTITVISENEETNVEKLVFASGGKSSSQLGSDGSCFDILAKHNYKISDLSPVLCPMKTKENTKLVDGVRSDVVLSVYQKDKLIHQETGELLFKDKGISGIVTFNASHYVNKTNKQNITFHIDFASLAKGKIEYKDYVKYVNPKLANYLVNNKQDIHNVIFTFKDFYDFSVAHVTHGGVELSELKANSLESNKENNVYFIGEILNIDGICGGFNMMWAFSSAYKLANEL